MNPSAMFPKRQVAYRLGNVVVFSTALSSEGEKYVFTEFSSFKIISKVKSLEGGK